MSHWSQSTWPSNYSINIEQTDCTDTNLRPTVSLITINAMPNKSISVICVIALCFWHPEKLSAEDTSTFDWQYFEITGHKAFVILPDIPTANRKDVPWVFYAPTFDGRLPNAKDEGWMIKRFLAKGIAIAGVDIGESFGSPAGRLIYSALHQHLVTNLQFDTKTCLLARSRGGLMLYNWAADNPEKIRCIAGIYPVCDLRSYPGLNRASTAYEMTAGELSEALPKHNPIDRLAPLAKANVPIFHIHGDVDVVVPLEANSETVANRYRQLEGSIQLQIAPHQGHNMWRGFFECQPLVDFVITHATAKLKVIPKVLTP